MVWNGHRKSSRQDFSRNYRRHKTAPKSVWHALTFDSALSFAGHFHTHEHLNSSNVKRKVSSVSYETFQRPIYAFAWEREQDLTILLLSNDSSPDDTTFWEFWASGLSSLSFRNNALFSQITSVSVFFSAHRRTLTKKSHSHSRQMGCCHWV